jgi:hypothetical protein
MKSLFLLLALSLTLVSPISQNTEGMPDCASANLDNFEKLSVSQYLDTYDVWKQCVDDGFVEERADMTVAYMCQEDDIPYVVIPKPWLQVIFDDLQMCIILHSNLGPGEIPPCADPWAPANRGCGSKV